MSNQASAPVLDKRVVDAWRAVAYALPRKPVFVYEASRLECRAKYLETLCANLHKVIDAALATKDRRVIAETRARVAFFLSDLAGQMDARFPDSDVCAATALFEEHIAECEAAPEQMRVAANPTPQNIERALPSARREMSKLAAMIRVWERKLFTHHARTA